VCKLVQSFPKGSAGGPSGLRPQLLQDAFATLFQHGLANQLTTFCNTLLRGEVPSEVKPWLFGATLAVLPVH